MTKNEMNTLAASAANDWCRCFKCDRIVNETKDQCVKPCGTCIQWFDGYKTAMIALEKLERQKESLHVSETCKENTDSFTSEDEK